MSAVTDTAARILDRHYAGRVPDARRIRADVADFIARAAVGDDDPAALDAAAREAWDYLTTRAEAQAYSVRRWRR